MSDSLRLLFTKEQQRAIQSGRFLQKSNRERLAQVALYKRAMWANHAWFEGIACKKDRFAGKIHMFHMFLTVFPFFMPKSESLPSLFPHTLFFKEQLEWFAPVTHYKKKLWAIRSGRSWQNSDLEQFTQVTHDKRVMGAICSFFLERITLSLTKRANCSKTWWANFQPWYGMGVVKKNIHGT